MYVCIYVYAYIYVYRNMHSYTYICSSMYVACVCAGCVVSMVYYGYTNTYSIHIHAYTIPTIRWQLNLLCSQYGVFGM